MGQAIETVMVVFEILGLIAWVAAIATWIRRGCPLPKWLHMLAGFFFVAGGCAGGFFLHAQAISPKQAGLFVLVPPALAYFMWLWMHGPDEPED